MVLMIACVKNMQDGGPDDCPIAYYDSVYRIYCSHIIISSMYFIVFELFHVFRMQKNTNLTTQATFTT